MNSFRIAKKALRQQLREILGNYSAKDFLSAGVIVAQHVDHWLSASNFAFKSRAAGTFSSLKDEIALAPLDFVMEQHGFILCRPEVFDNTQMIFKPELNLDIIFVPALAFDRHGHRLGRGFGFYDRFLSGLDHGTTKPILMGLAMDAQILESIPVEEHDMAMDYICTPSEGVLRAQRE